MFDIPLFITTAGYVGIAAVIFAESGLLIGVILPGDSLLFTAGFLASQGFLDIAIVVSIAFVAAVVGDSVGYWLGKRFGPTVFSRPGSLLLDPRHISRAERFYDRHGPKTIVLARFVPLMRTFAPVLAGVGSMRYRTFLGYNILGGALWGIGLPLAGYWLGQTIPNADQYLAPIIIGIVILSLLPGAYHFLIGRE
jgi:membrane-associated protein